MMRCVSYSVTHFASICVVLFSFAAVRGIHAQDTAPNEATGLDRVNARLKVLLARPEHASSIASWAASIQIVSGDKVDFAKMVMFVCQHDAIWSKTDEFHADVLKSLIARTDQLTPEVLNEWQLALKTACGEEPEKINCVLPLVHTNRIFTDQTLNREEFNATVKRLKLLPAESVAAWAKATKTDEMGAALFLVRFDSLFDGDKFQAEAFQRGLKKVSGGDR